MRSLQLDAFGDQLPQARRRALNPGRLIASLAWKLDLALLLERLLERQLALATARLIRSQEAS
jgi:hypothetical protein